MAGKAREAVDIKVRQQAKAMFIAGVTPGRIARECGVVTGTIRVWATRYKWTQEKEASKEVIADKIVSRIDSRPNTVPNGHSVAAQEHVKRINDVADSLIDRFSKLDLKATHSATEIATAMKTMDDIKRRNLGLGDEAKQTSTFNFHLGEAAPMKKVIDVSVPVKVIDEPASGSV